MPLEEINSYLFLNLLLFIYLCILNFTDSLGGAGRAIAKKDTDI